jgi:hypothetical protein
VISHIHIGGGAKENHLLACLPGTVRMLWEPHLEQVDLELGQVVYVGSCATHNPNFQVISAWHDVIRSCFFTDTCMFFPAALDKRLVVQFSRADPPVSHSHLRINRWSLARDPA